MAQRDQFRGSSWRPSPRRRGRSPADCLWDFRAAWPALPAYPDEGMRPRRPFGLRISGNIHHAGAAGGIEMGEPAHFNSTRIRSPAAQVSRPASVTRKALARVERGDIAGTLPSQGSHLRPVRTEAGGQESESTRSSVETLATAATRSRADRFRIARQRISTAARAKSSNVTMVDTGFPGSPKRTYLGPFRIPAAVRVECGPGRRRTPRRVRQHALHHVVLSGRDAAGDQKQIEA